MVGLKLGHSRPKRANNAPTGNSISTRSVHHCAGQPHKSTAHRVQVAAASVAADHSKGVEAGAEAHQPEAAGAAQVANPHRPTTRGVAAVQPDHGSRATTHHPRAKTPFIFNNHHPKTPRPQAVTTEQHHERT